MGEREHKSSDAAIDLTEAEKITFLLLFIGYIAYYLTRNNITIASVSMKELRVLTIAQIGYLSALGAFINGIGKFVNGFLADFFGGKRIFLLGMFGSVGASVLFGLSSDYPLFFITWGINSFFLSMGWVGLIKVCSYWFSGDNRGTILGGMSLNYQLGSTIARALTTFLLAFPILVWRGLFFVPALILLVMAFFVLILLKEKPDTVENPRTREETTDETDDKNKKYNWLTWKKLFQSPAFILILWGSASITLIRTYFEDFTALWLNQSGMNLQAAGYISALFIIGGMIGTVLIGFLSDRIGRGNRGPFMVLSGFLLGIMLLFSGFFPKNSILFSAVFFFMTGIALYGMYSILAGISAIDFGGQVSPSTAAGFIDGVGYLASSGAGILVAQTSHISQWDSITFWFAVLIFLISLTFLPLWKNYPTKSIT